MFRWSRDEGGFDVTKIVHKKAASPGEPRIYGVTASLGRADSGEVDVGKHTLDLERVPPSESIQMYCKTK